MQVTAAQIALITADAASYDRAGAELWVALVTVCVEAGYELPEIVALMKSSHIRHFLDQNEGKTVARTAQAFDKLVFQLPFKTRRDLVACTFGNP